MRNARFRVAVEHCLAIGNIWRVAGVGNRDPKGADDDDPGHGWPASVREQADKPVLDRRIEYTPVGREDNSGDAKVDVGDVEPGKVIEEDDPEASEHGSAAGGVALVQLRFQGARWLEGLSLAAEPFRK